MKKLEAVAIHPLDMNTVVTPQGVRASESGNGTNAKQGNIYYLTGNKKAYEAYLNGEYKNKTDITREGSAFAGFLFVSLHHTKEY